ncbi:transcriptional repressor NsrR [Pseudobythopirellula maris]|uniref:Transcriptional repressor NsrR n=1 Tax=Pseudobythopirellula maris TaxID=2527991 RepID=A0A5C5ZXP3_9BACT|nr:Rrf2 family transcriptional regulator [Pseudobythopirellula maris]TWT91033.1 transcriptional repressor NsrR [Pseudobythopirellula maris]
MLSKTHEYALRAVTCLAARDGAPASADLIAEKTQAPRRYLTRVLQDLVAAGLVASRSGPGGGYELAPGGGDLTILDVVNAVAPLERIRSCPLGLTSHTELCPLHAQLDKVYESAERALAEVTIAELLSSTSPIVPLCEVVTQSDNKKA